MIELAPSILAADFTRLGQQVSDALACGVKRIHCDIMDGQFVPNISMGPLVVQAIKPIVAKMGAMIETHLMIEQPDRYIADFVQAGANLVTVHVETCPHLHRTLQQIRELGAQVGVALNPATPLVMLEEILGDVDLVLVMTVNPGFGGQEFIPQALEKLQLARKRIDDVSLATGRGIMLEVDGGVNAGNIASIARAGADTFVAGSAIFGSTDYRATIAQMRDALKAVA